MQEKDLLWHHNFAADVLSGINNGSGYLNRACFSEEATFHISSKVIDSIFRIWGSQNPHDVENMNTLARN
jgi:hypothetical protein